MNQQIIVDQNLVMLGDSAFDVDCSTLATIGIVFVGVEGERRWLETEPFTGPMEGPEVDFSAAEAIFSQAHAMAEAANAPPAIEELAAEQRTLLEQHRKDAEAEGVTINKVRYAGDPSNRQALREALDLAEETGLDAFPSWKDSDGEFRADLPVADIHKALMAIAERRSQLIAVEGELNAQIDAAIEAEDREALKAIAWAEKG